MADWTFMGRKCIRRFRQSTSCLNDRKLKERKKERNKNKETVGGHCSFQIRLTDFRIKILISCTQVLTEQTGFSRKI
jgi:hypothetical protein